MITLRNRGLVTRLLRKTVGFSLIVWALKNGKLWNSESLKFCLFVCFGFIAEVSSPRFYVGHSIYKGKAALTIEPRAPEFVALEVCVFVEDQKLYCIVCLILDWSPFFMFWSSLVRSSWQRKVFCCSNLLLQLVFVNMIGVGSRFGFYLSLTTS